MIVNTKKSEALSALLIMTAACLSVVIPLIVLKKLLFVFIFYHIIACVAVPIIDLLIIKRLSMKESLDYLGFSKIKRKSSITVGFLHGIFFLVATIIGFLIFRDFIESGDIIGALRSWGVPEQGKWVIFFIMVIFNGIIEEIFWRGYIYGKLKDAFSNTFVISVVTLFYTSYHLATVLSFFAPSFISLQIIVFILIAGLIWGWMRYKFNNIWASAIGHTLATVGYMVVYLMV